MARKNPMAIRCPDCGGRNVRMSRWTNRVDQFLDLLGMPPMRCIDCGYRWRHSLWRLREVFHARCPRCYRLELVHWEETYYHIPRWWRFCIKLGGKKVRCKVCRHNFVSFRMVKGIRKWVDPDPSKPIVESTMSLSEVDREPKRNQGL